MPTFDFRGIRCAKYNNDNGTISYTEHTPVGDAMDCNLALKFAEGRLHAEGRLAEYLKLATGGTISIGVKYIPDKAQVLMYKARTVERQIEEKKVPSLAYSTKSTGSYVGVTFYAPDMIDGVEKFTCVFVPKALFGPPSYVFKTKGDSIQFNTPTTTGEFLASDDANQDLLEVAICDTEDEAIAWGKAALQETSSQQAAKVADEPAVQGGT